MMLPPNNFQGQGLMGNQQATGSPDQNNSFWQMITALRGQPGTGYQDPNFQTNADARSDRPTGDMMGNGMGLMNYLPNPNQGLLSFLPGLGGNKGNTDDGPDTQGPQSGNGQENIFSLLAGLL